MSLKDKLYYSAWKNDTMDRKKQSKMLNVLLYFKNSPVAQCRLSHIGLFGIQLECCPIVYSKYSHIEVQFIDENKINLNDPPRFPAIVTSCSPEGMGLAIDPNLYEKWFNEIPRDFSPKWQKSNI